MAAEEQATEANQEQNKRAAQHLLDEIERRQSDRRPQGVDWMSSAPAWGALLISIGGFAYSAGIISQRVDDQGRRIGSIEDAELAAGIARLESKVDVLLEDRASRRSNEQ